MIFEEKIIFALKNKGWFLRMIAEWNFKNASKITYLITLGNIKLKKNKKIPVRKINFA